jgi:hypothetical protein
MRVRLLPPRYSRHGRHHQPCGRFKEECHLRLRIIALPRRADGGWRRCCMTFSAAGMNSTTGSPLDAEIWSEKLASAFTTLAALPGSMFVR